MRVALLHPTGCGLGAHYSRSSWQTPGETASCGPRVHERQYRLIRLSARLIHIIWHDDDGNDETLLLDHPNLSTIRDQLTDLCGLEFP